MRVVDAILGALCEGDIGVHFPAQRSAMARRLFRPLPCIAVERVQARGGGSAHLDATIVCEAPRASARIATPCARALPRSRGIPESRVAIKATTSEKLGFTGRAKASRPSQCDHSVAVERLTWSTRRSFADWPACCSDLCGRRR